MLERTFLNAFCSDSLAIPQKFLLSSPTFTPEFSFSIPPPVPPPRSPFATATAFGSAGDVRARRAQPKRGGRHAGGSPPGIRVVADVSLHRVPCVVVLSMGWTDV